MLAKSGDYLLLPEAVDSLSSLLMPLATLITPNLPEACAFTGIKAASENEMIAVAQKLLNFGSPYVLLKGGHLVSQESNDLLLGKNGLIHWIKGPRIASKNTHGTGCTLSAAIASYLAQNVPVKQACILAKNYVFGAISAAKENSVGHGNGPLHHFYHLWPSVIGQVPYTESSTNGQI